MIYPNNIHIGAYLTRCAISELYHLPEIKPWHVLSFAKNHGNIIITSKDDIEALAHKHDITIK